MNEYTEAPDGAYWQGYRDAIKDAKAAVGARATGGVLGNLIYKADAIAAIAALGGEQ